MSDQKIFIIVKENYGSIARAELSNESSSGCCSTTSACCEPSTIQINTKETLSLGCYNNLVEASTLEEGLTVLDLGCGPGHDLIEAAKIVGDKGKAFGLDMTDEMLELAKENTKNMQNVQIIKGNLQNIPLPDNSVDVIISNCVFNLAPDKELAFQEAYRVLKPEGRIVESDITLEYDLDSEDTKDDSVYCGCIGGAIEKNSYINHIKKAGFEAIETEVLFEGEYLINGKKYPYHSVLFSAHKPKKKHDKKFL